MMRIVQHRRMRSSAGNTASSAKKQRAHQNLRRKKYLAEEGCTSRLIFQTSTRLMMSFMKSGVIHMMKSASTEMNAEKNFLNSSRNTSGICGINDNRRLKICTKLMESAMAKDL